MANRFFNQFSLGLEKAPVRLYAKVAIGASGAPTISAANSKGVASITRNSAGNYTIVLQDTYVKLMSISAKGQNSTGISASPDMGVKTISVTSLTSPSVNVVFSTGGVATDPASGDTLYFEIVLSNSTAL
jgi:hypothetical protein